jgi:hypothetical protein
MIPEQNYLDFSYILYIEYISCTLNLEALFTWLKSHLIFIHIPFVQHHLNIIN